MSGRFRRRGWRSSRFAGRRSFRNGYRTSIRSRARGNQRAASQQADASDVVINLMHKFRVGLTGMERADGFNDLRDFVTGTYAVNIYDLLRKSEFFDSYSKMYDQFRITSIKVKLTPVSWFTYDQWNLPNNISTTPRLTADDPVQVFSDVVGDGNPAPVPNNEVPPGGPGNEEGLLTKYHYLYPQALTIVTAWDRTGLDESQFVPVYEHNIEEDAEEPGPKLGYVTTINDNITTYSSAKSVQLIAGHAFNCVRYLYPSSVQEKSLFLSTDQLKKDFDDQDSQRWYIYSPEDGEGNIHKEYITNLYSNPNCPFKPTFICGVLSIDPLEVNGENVNNAYHQNLH